MHQQLRVAVTRSGTSEGPGAEHHAPAERDPLEVRQGTLASVLERVAKEGFDLRIAGGSSIEGPGELVLAVDDDGDRMDRLHELLAAEYEVRRVEVRFRELQDEAGALARFIRDLANEGLIVNEIFVGTKRNDLVPVQVTTIRATPPGSATA